MIENTSHRDPLVHLVGAVSDGTAGYVTGMEAGGGRQLAGSELLPVEMHPEDPAEWESLGFVFGDVQPGDPLFRRAAIPGGWRREAGGGDPRGSYVTDGRGIRRVSIWYKAAFYDRQASMTLVNVGRDVVTQAVYGELAIDWAPLTPGEVADAVAYLRHYLTKADEYPSVYGDRQSRVEALLASAPAEA